MIRELLKTVKYVKVGVKSDVRKIVKLTRLIRYAIKI